MGSGVGLGMSVRVGDGSGVEVGVSSTSGVKEGVNDGISVGVDVGVGLGETDASSVRVKVGLGVVVKSSVAVSVGEGVSVGVGVDVGGGRLLTTICVPVSWRMLSTPVAASNVHPGWLRSARWGSSIPSTVTCVGVKFSRSLSRDALSKVV